MYTSHWAKATLLFFWLGSVFFPKRTRYQITTVVRNRRHVCVPHLQQQQYLCLWAPNVDKRDTHKYSHLEDNILQSRWSVQLVRSLLLCLLRWDEHVKSASNCVPQTDHQRSKICLELVSPYFVGGGVPKNRSFSLFLLQICVEVCVKSFYQNISHLNILHFVLFVAHLLCQGLLL